MLQVRGPAPSRRTGQVSLQDEEQRPRQTRLLNLLKVMRIPGWRRSAGQNRVAYLTCPSSLLAVGEAVQSKFEEIRRSNQAAAKRLVESHVSSSSSDEENDDAGDRQRGKVLESTFTSYTSQTGEKAQTTAVLF